MELTGWRLPVGLVAFLGEVALVAGAGFAAYRLAGGGGFGWAAALGVAVALIVLWGSYMAPRAPRRLTRPARAGLAALLCGAVAVALSLSVGGGMWVPVFAWLGIVLAGTQLALPDTAPGSPADRQRSPRPVG